MSNLQINFLLFFCYSRRRRVTIQCVIRPRGRVARSRVILPVIHRQLKGPHPPTIRTRTARQLARTPPVRLSTALLVPVQADTVTLRTALRVLPVMAPADTHPAIRQLAAGVSQAVPHTAITLTGSKL